MDATAGDECVPPFSRKYVDMQGLIEGAEQIKIVFYECRLYNRSVFLLQFFGIYFTVEGAHSRGIIMYRYD